MSNIKEFIQFARKIQKRDKWFIGGFLGVVQQEWEEKEEAKYANQKELPCGCMSPAKNIGEICPHHRRSNGGYA